MKNQPEDKFEQRIRERLQSWEAAPAENAWSRITSDLPVRSFPWRRIIVVGLCIGIIGGITLVEKLTTQTADERIAPEDTSWSSFKADTLADHPPSLTLPLTKGPSGSDSSEPSADITEESRVRKPAFRHSKHGQHPVDQHRAYADQVRPSGNLSRVPVNPPKNLRDVVYDYTRQPINKQRSEDPRFVSAATDQTDTDRRSRAQGSQVAPSVATIQAYALSTAIRLPVVVTDVSSVKLPSQPHHLPDASVPGGPWELWITANPMLLYQQVTPDTTDAINITSLNRTSSKDRLGAQVSVGVRYPLSPRVAVELGAYYRYTRNHWTYNYHETLTDSFRTVVIDETTIQAQPIYEEQVESIRETNHALGALAGVRYRLSSRWLSNTVGGELQAHRDRGRTAWFTQVSYSAEKALNEHWSVFGGLTFLWNVSGDRQSYEYFALKPYGFGVRFGVNYQLPLGKR